nr:PQQ-dependent sugar dehydrogenase [Clostridium saccharoperbutylacetonicum]
MIISIIIVVSAFGVFSVSSQYRMNTLGSNVSWSVAYKNCNGAEAFDKDENRNTYIAFDNSIKVIKENGLEENLIQDKTLKIENMIFYNNKLYFISKSELYSYDLNNKALKVLLDNIPCEGKYLDRNLIIKNSNLLLSIGSATNSGIASYDSNYSPDKIPYDRSSMDIILNGINYGDEKTGAFMPYGNSSQEGQKIKAQNLANASVYEINLNNNKSVLYASGLRNITGWDFDDKGDLIGIIGGMENVGERSVAMDSDYLYKIDKGKWYGWPDFSGGDPINSPRFKGEKLVAPLIANPPNKIVAGPIYKYTEAGTMRYLAIDKEGKILDKDTKIYYDSKQNIITSLSSNYIISDLLKLKDKSEIKGIKYYEGDVYILDSGLGCIYKMQANNLKFQFKLPIQVWIFVGIMLAILVSLIIYKLQRKRKIKR